MSDIGKSEEKAGEPICHKWIFDELTGVSELKSLVHSGTFISEVLPDVRFEIFCEVIEDTKMTVTISKNPGKSASAQINIKQRFYQNQTFKIKGWTNKCILEVKIKNLSDWYHQMKKCPFFCTIVWGGYEKIDPLPQTNLYHYTKNLLTSSDLADMVIVIDNEEIPVHKVVLGCQSPVFMAMFKTDMKESSDHRIVVEDVDSYTMKNALQYLYTGEVDSDLNVDEILSILKMADKYQITELKRLCEFVLSTKMNIDNALKILEEANLYSVPALIEKTVAFMVENKQEIVISEAFGNLYHKNAELLLEFVINSIAECSEAPKYTLI